jgi:hypothetical protein
MRRCARCHRRSRHGAGSPEMLALLLHPGEGALIDRDDELRDISQNLEELGIGGFHAFSRQQKMLIAMSF